MSERTQRYELWEILRDLNSTNKFPLGMRLKSLGPAWQENGGTIVEVRPLNGHHSNEKILIVIAHDVDDGNLYYPLVNRPLNLVGHAYKYPWEVIN